MQNREESEVQGEKKQKKSFFSFRLVFDDKAIEKNTTRFFSPSPSLSFPLFGPLSDAREFFVPLSEVAKTKQRKHRRPPKSIRSNERWPKRFDALELAAMLDDDGAPSTIPKEPLVSIFIAVEDDFLVRHTVLGVCKGSAGLYRSKDASPLHETLEVDFEKEVSRRGKGRRTRRSHRSRRRSGLFAALLSTPPGSSHGPRGAPARCASCTSRRDAPELSRTSARRTSARSSPSRPRLEPNFGFVGASTISTSQASSPAPHSHEFPIASILRCSRFFCISSV